MLISIVSKKKTRHFIIKRLKKMHPFTREFIQLKKAHEYSDLLEDTEWGLQRLIKFQSEPYSDLMEDTEWALNY